MPTEPERPVPTFDPAIPSASLLPNLHWLLQCWLHHWGRHDWIVLPDERVCRRCGVAR